MFEDFEVFEFVALRIFFVDEKFDLETGSENDFGEVRVDFGVPGDSGGLVVWAEGFICEREGCLVNGFDFSLEDLVSRICFAGGDFVSPFPFFFDRGLGGQRSEASDERFLGAVDDLDAGVGQFFGGFIVFDFVD